jgi:hypothetical protein
MKSKYILGLLTLLTANLTYANPALNHEREDITKQYVMDLQKADYKDIYQLFEKNGIVVSTSRGKVDAKEFFYAFLPEIQSAATEIHQTFSGTDKNRLAVRFHFAFKLKDGSSGEGEYVDEFIFTENSNKLAAVYMFENLKLTDMS